jgi:hypothetical protein
VLNFTPPTTAQALAHGHGLDNTSGYVVRRTFPGQPERVHEDVATTQDYSAALAVAGRVRAQDGCWAVIDRLHSCGCRELG